MTALAGIEALRGALPRARERPIAAYPIGGRLPALALRPESGEGVARVLAAAKETGAAVVPQGARTALSLGRTVSRYDVALDLTGLDHIIEYEPADMTVTLEAGVTLAALQERLAEEGQYLSVDPPPSDDVTVGGLLATARAGAWRGHLPAARDLVLGITIATPEGTLVSSGGRVVKNVTGYDLHRLHTGALGALGVIVSASFKVAPLPEATATLALRSADLAIAERAAFEVRDRRLPLRALSILDAPTARAVGFELATPAAIVLVAFEGVPAVVARAERESRDLARRLHVSVESVPAQGWQVLRHRAARAAAAEADPGSDGVLLRLGVPPAQVCATLGVVHAAGLEGWGHVVSGAVLARGDGIGADTITALHAHARALGGFLAIEDAPATLREVAGPPPDLDLTRALKRAFDPTGVLNPGRWAEDV